jgi:hypothetical protein
MLINSSGATSNSSKTNIFEVVTLLISVFPLPVTSTWRLGPDKMRKNVKTSEENKGYKKVAA